MAKLGQGLFNKITSGYRGHMAHRRIAGSIGMKRLTGPAAASPHGSMAGPGNKAVISKINAALRRQVRQQAVQPRAKPQPVSRRSPASIESWAESQRANIAAAGPVPQAAGGVGAMRGAADTVAMGAQGPGWMRGAVGLAAGMGVVSNLFSDEGSFGKAAMWGVGGYMAHRSLGPGGKLAGLFAKGIKR